MVIDSTPSRYIIHFPLIIIHYSFYITMDYWDCCYFGRMAF